MSYTGKNSSSRGRSGSNQKILPALRKMDSNLMYKPKSFKMNQSRGKGKVYSNRNSDEANTNSNPGLAQTRNDLVTGTLTLAQKQPFQSRTMDIQSHKRYFQILTFTNKILL